jgi:Cu-Zn family superoxide dismutase
MQPATMMGEVGTSNALPGRTVPAPEPVPEPDPTITAVVSLKAAGTFKAKTPKNKKADTDAEDSADAPSIELAADELGRIEIVERDGLVTMTGVFKELAAGEHGIFILANGDCKARKIAHFNPTEAKHGPPAAGERHAGDYGNLSVAKDGTARFEMVTDSVTVSSVNAIVGKAFVVTSKKDNGKSQPDGRSGSPIACGVIELSGDEPVLLTNE